MMNDSQVKLVKESIAGERNSLEQLLEYYMKDILFFSTLHSNKQEAEDIAQTVALKICEKIHTLTNPHYFITWLSVIVRNTSARHMKHIQKLNTYDTSLEVLEQHVERIQDENMEFLPEKYVEHVELRSAIIKEIHKLPPKQRLCLAYYYLYNMKRSEIAEATGLTPRQVSTGLNYGKQTLKEQLEKQFGTRFLYSVLPVGVVPTLTTAFRMDRDLLITNECCKQVQQAVLDKIALIQPDPSKGAFASLTTYLACAAVVCGVTVTAVLYARDEVIPEYVPSLAQETIEEAALPEEVEMVDFEIRTIADMIGQNEADWLEDFVNHVEDPQEWAAFILHIGAERDRIASGSGYTYTTYILEKQNKRLLLAQQDTTSGETSVQYIFGDREEPIPGMVRIVLNFTE